jgi:hypothetical protein
VRSGGGGGATSEQVGSGGGGRATSGQVRSGGEGGATCGLKGEWLWGKGCLWLEGYY